MKNDSANDSRRVCFYGRVSTEHEAQVSALGNQIQYYDNIISQHPNWTLVQQYIDEGITGTSYKKRPAFLHMIEDAKAGKFDLIITREVSRFARNTVDTLVYTRELKKYGVEVYFTEDNIWTMRDEDGELRLTIMATLAQNESKKISERVKAGQKISFQNGVIYGNGNILGYDRIGDQMVINQEQAETVKRIFDLYAEGHGLRHIQFVLEQEGRKTSTGLTKWNCTTINYILTNVFYCGKIEYRKQFVPDFLEQQKVNNHGEVERIIVQGNHPPIVSLEQFDRCQRIHDSRSRQVSEYRKQGTKPPVSVWCKKLKCSCGSSWNRKAWHTNSNGVKQYAYQCYNQIRTGSPRTRERKGLSTEGICNAPMIPQWKLDIVMTEIAKLILQDKKKICDYATETLMKHLDTNFVEEQKGKLRKLEKEQIKCANKLSNLVDLMINGDVPKELYLKKKEELEKSIDDKKNEIEFIKAEIESLSINENVLNDYLEKLKNTIDELADFDANHVPEHIVDVLIKEVIVKDNNLHVVLNCEAGDVYVELPERKYRKKDCTFDSMCGTIKYIPHFVEGCCGENSTFCEEQHRLQLMINNHYS